jgi:hydroxyacylglutathione hydrolase
MSQEIRLINLGGLLGIGANCYLVKTDAGYILIDTGFSTKRTELEKKLDMAGCKPGNLLLIVITHGHGDHTGNSAYLREKYGTKIIMHCGDAKMVEGEDTGRNTIERIILATLSFLFRLGKVERFRPDTYIEDGYDFSGYGFDAKVIHIPGHSKGSIGILTSNGDLFCGDLFINRGKPGKHFIIDDPTAFNASIEKLKSLPINMVYPGHGKPFLMEMFIRNDQ